MYNFGRLKKIDCYTYDIINHGFKCILTKNDIALNQYVSKDIWDSIIKKKLSSDQRNKARNFIDLHIKGLNTQMKYQDEKSEIMISELFVDSGRMLKRMQPAPQGRAHRIRKRSNHVTLILGLKNN